MKISILLVFLFFTQVSFTCSCNIGDVPEKFKDSSNVFTGVVTSVERVGVTNTFGDEKIIVKFELSKLNY